MTENTVRRPSIVIVSPALSDANNGNWQTARRWQNLLSECCDVRIVKAWNGHPAGRPDDAMIALHARRSASAIRAWSNGCPPSTLAVVLTGTDLYRDIQSDADAQQSLQLAGHLVVLQSLGIAELPKGLHGKTRVILQSTTTMPGLHKTGRMLRCIAVGHLRPEKAPDTLMDAAVLLSDERGLRIDHLGAPLDDALAEKAGHTMTQNPAYRWLGAQPHGATRRRIQQAHVLIHPSRMEGGAHVVMEAVSSGTPVLASRISGNVGMLGDDYAGYFPVGDAVALAGLIRQLRQDLRDRDLLSAGKTGSRQDRDNSTLLATLLRQCAARAPLFAPHREQQALLQLVSDLTGVRCVR